MYNGGYFTQWKNEVCLCLSLNAIKLHVPVYRYFSFIQLIFTDLKKKGQKLEYLIFKLINFNFLMHPFDCHLGSDTEGWPNFLD